MRDYIELEGDKKAIVGMSGKVHVREEPDHVEALHHGMTFTMEDIEALVQAVYYQDPESLVEDLE